VLTEWAIQQPSLAVGDTMEEEITQAVALLIKNGFESQSISTSIAAGQMVKISIELAVIGPAIADANLKKLAFEKAWFQEQ
jgi:hypothetical protein